MPLAAFALLSILSLTYSPSAQAECLDTAATEAIKAEFSFEGPENTAVKLDLCNESSTGFAALRALQFMKELPALDLPKSEFNNNFIDTHPYAYFKARVKKIVLDERKDSEACPDQRLAFVSPYMREEKKFWVCPNAANFGVITLSSAFIHEARHEDGGEFAHKMCAAGPYANQLSCDQSYADGGAYAIGLEYLVKLSRAEKLDPEIRERARSLAIADFLQRFNDLPLDLQAGALLRDDASGALSFFDGDKESGLGLNLNASTILSIQAGLPLIFDPAKEEASVYAYRAGSLAAPVSDVLTRHFANALSPDERSELRDVIYTKDYACILLKRGLRCYRPDRETFALAISHFEPRRFVYGERSRILGAGSVAILGQDGFLYALPGEAESLQRSNPKAWPKSKGPAALVAAEKWPGGELVLQTDGTVNTFSYRERKATPVPSLAGRKFRDLKAPFVWSKKLESF